MAATAEDHADSTLISIGIYPCDEDHGDTKACTKCRFSKYNQNGKMFEKKLSPSDTQKKGSYRLYLRRQDAAKFCHPIFGHLSNGSELIVYDVHVKQHWLVRFRSCGGKHYLTGGWNRFAEDKQLRGGDGITSSWLESNAKVVFRFLELQSIKQLYSLAFVVSDFEVSVKIYIYILHACNFFFLDE